MDDTEILRRVTSVAAQHFNQPGLILTRDTVAGDVAGWDSLAHIQFLMEIENALRVRFKSSEVSGFANVGQLIDRIAAKLRG